MGNGFDGTISRVDGAGRVVKTFRPEPRSEGRLPISAGGGGVWVASQDASRGGTLTRFDASGHRVRTYRGVGLAESIAVDAGVVWIADASSDVVERFDATSGRIVRPPIPVGGRASAVIAGDGSVWALIPAANTLVQIDPKRNAVAGSIPVPGDVTALVATPGRIWLGSASGLLTAIDNASHQVLETKPLGRPIDALAAEDGLLLASVG